MGLLRGLLDRLAPEVQLELLRSRTIVQLRGHDALELGSRVTVLNSGYDPDGRFRPGRIIAIERAPVAPGPESPDEPEKQLDLFDEAHWLRLEQLGHLTEYFALVLRPCRRAAWGRRPRVVIRSLVPRAYETGRERRQPTEPELKLLADALLAAGAREVRVDLPGLPQVYVFGPEGLDVEKRAAERKVVSSQ